MLENRLVEAIRDHQVIPFVGAGVSMSLGGGLPSFNDLIAELAPEVDYDADVFRRLGAWLPTVESELRRASSV